jgi:lipopolysaccharide biosynthesis glycosyltransferase
LRASADFHQAYVVAIDDKFIEPFVVFLSSLLKHTKVLSGTGLILLYDSASMSRQGLERLQREVLPRFAIDCAFIDCKAIIPSSIKWQPSDHVSKATYYRLFFFDLLPERVRRVVYIDIDMVVTGDISDLFGLSFDEPLAAVNHYSGVDEVRLWGDAVGTYFNAGLIVFDVAKIQSQGFVMRYIEVLETMGARIVWHDQDVLNMAHENHWHHLPWYYNLTRAAQQALAPVDMAKLRVIHYDGWNKPWVKDVVRPLDEYWHRMHWDVHAKWHVNATPLGRVRSLLKRFYGQSKSLMMQSWTDFQTLRNVQGK